MEIARDAIWLLIKISAPLLLAALAVGLMVSLFQALTQIHEPTLSFVPKILAIFAVLLLSMNYIGSSMAHFTEELMTHIINLE